MLLAVGNPPTPAQQSIPQPPTEAGGDLSSPIAPKGHPVRASQGRGGRCICTQASHTSAPTKIPPSTHLSSCRVISASSHACSFQEGSRRGGQAEQSRQHNSSGPFHRGTGQGFLVPSRLFWHNWYLSILGFLSVSLKLPNGSVLGCVAGKGTDLMMPTGFQTRAYCFLQPVGKMTVPAMDRELRCVLRLREVKKTATLSLKDLYVVLMWTHVWYPVAPHAATYTCVSSRAHVNKVSSTKTLPVPGSSSPWLWPQSRNHSHSQCVWVSAGVILL